MRWSATVGRFAGIDVKIHATFVLLLGWVAVSHWMSERSVGAIVAGLAFILAIFGCVVLHEFGHALTAKRYGVKTRDIILLPIGGVARLERIPDEPKQELVIAAAGPAVNVVIAMVIAGWLQLTGGWAPVEELAVSGGAFLERMLVVNIFLVVFNLIPAFPMDGGRMLRALLALKMEYVKATQIAASVGQMLAYGFGFLGLFTNPFLVFIALFVWIGAAQEASMVQMKSALGGIPLESVMITDYKTLAPTDPLGRAVELTLATSQKDFPVVFGDRLEGVLTQAALFKALSQNERQIQVSEIMDRDFQSASLTEMIEPVFARLQASNCRTIPIVHAGRLVGLVTMDNVGEFLRIQSALRK